MRICAVSLVFACALARGGELTGEIRLARKYSKRTIAAPVYNLRAAPVALDAPAAPAAEMDRVAILLIGESDSPAPAITASMDQRNRHFEPELLIVPTGSTVVFPNSDPIFHNIFSLSKTKSFDLGFYPKGQSRTVRFDHPGIVQVYCHLHPAMHAAIVVAGSRVMKPDVAGTFSFGEVPAGRYELVVWHNTAGRFQRSVDIPADGLVRQVVSIPLDDEVSHH